MMCRLQSPAAVKALALVATKGKSEAARVSAAVALLDRGYGKPRQSIDLEGNLTIKDLTDEQLEQRFAELVGKA